MIADQANRQTIDEYIASFPEDIQEILRKIRMTIRTAAPAAEETLKYGMPTFTLKGNLVHFAVFKKHIGFFPPIHGPAELKAELAPYTGAKGSFQFPLDQPIPYDLLRKIVAVRVQENLAKAAAKREKK